MCGDTEDSLKAPDFEGASTAGVWVGEGRDDEELIQMARHLLTIPEQRSAHLGSIGYGGVSAGDKVLVAIDNTYDRHVVSALVTAFRERGARVDLMVTDAGDDRRFGEDDELSAAIRTQPWQERPRRWEGNPHIEELALVEGYDLLVHGKGGPTAQTSFRYEQFPWTLREYFTPEIVTYPSELIALSSQITWDNIWRNGRGGRVRLTDLEGTDFTYTLNEAYWDGSHYGWVPEPKKLYGHLLGHPTPPLPYADASGTVKGTTSHFNRAFPQITLHLKDGQVASVDGGGGYGVAWSTLLDMTSKIHYPGFARPGLFNLWEVAIGGHPKVRRPNSIEWWSSGGFEWERRRSGIIHLGFGTFWRGPDEVWAAGRGIPYGHLHVHLLFPTFVLETADGGKIQLISNGRLVALDDPRVRLAAARYGDPDQLLGESWIPSIPGITAEGSYEKYKADPAAYIYGP